MLHRRAKFFDTWARFYNIKSGVGLMVSPNYFLAIFRFICAFLISFLIEGPIRQQDQSSVKGEGRHTHSLSLRNENIWS